MNSISIEDPQLAIRVPARQRCCQPSNGREHGGLILVFESQDNNPRVFAGRVRSDETDAAQNLSGLAPGGSHRF